MTWTLFWPITLVVLGNLLYHLAQKNMPSALHPAWMLVMAYAVALVGALLWLACDRVQRGALAPRMWSGWNLLLGLAVVLIELGFLFAYRAGWRVSLAAIYSHVVLALLLVPIGIGWFGERLNFTQWIGFVCAVVGLFVLGRG